MRQIILLRITAAFALLFAIGHLLGGGKQWSPMGPNPVLNAMTEHRFDVMGAGRSYFDFYMGFGWIIGTMALMQAVLLWQLASLARIAPRQAKQMTAVIAVANLVETALAWKFLFVVPALFSSALLGLLIAATAAFPWRQLPNTGDARDSIGAV